MIVGAGGGRLIALVLLALATASGSEALAASRAAELGPEAMLAEPSGGFVGRLSVTPEHGPVGTPLKIIGDMLGHTSAAATAEYLKLATEDLRTIGIDLPGGIMPWA